jgi:hypothetical protein
MDTDKKQNSPLANDKELKNAKRNNVTGGKTSDVRRENDRPVTPVNQDAGKHDPSQHDPRNQEPRKHPANEDPTKHDPAHDTTRGGRGNQDAAMRDKSKTATGAPKHS